jgi:hypothetical protein
MAADSYSSGQAQARRMIATGELHNSYGNILVDEPAAD